MPVAQSQPRIGWRMAGRSAGTGKVGAGGRATQASERKTVAHEERTRGATAAATAAAEGTASAAGSAAASKQENEWHQLAEAQGATCALPTGAHRIETPVCSMEKGSVGDQHPCHRMCSSTSARPAPFSSLLGSPWSPSSRTTLAGPPTASPPRSPASSSLAHPVPPVSPTARHAPSAVPPLDLPSLSSITRALPVLRRCCPSSLHRAARRRSLPTPRDHGAATRPATPFLAPSRPSSRPESEPPTRCCPPATLLCAVACLTATACADSLLRPFPAACRSLSSTATTKR